jgi:two-component system response regulator AtoC
MKKKKNILVVDDESAMRKNIKDILSIEGYNVFEAENGLEAINRLKSNDIDLVLLDFNMPQMDGIAVLYEIRKINSDLPVIMLTAYGTNERVIEAMKSGAYDYMEKPFELAEFLIIVERAIKYSELIKEVKNLRNRITEEPKIISGEEQIIGRSSKMKDILKLIGKAAPSDATVLIQGESGTGKELIADAIQRHSLQRDKPYIKVNCGAFSESLLESEIFGHEKGAFTGAISQKFGRFELANGGTVFLDEINNMPPSLQIRLLRILQHQTFYRVGGEIPVPINIRIIAASNKNVETEVEEGRLRKDLYYRLNVIRINIPPLRERIEDIPPLIENFLKKYSSDKKLIVTQENIDKMKNYSWPGNVRELENNIQRAIVIARDNIINIETGLAERPEFYTDSPFDKIINHGESMKSITSAFERQIILKALEQTRWNRTETAKLLRINRRLLYSKMKEFKLDF